MFEDVQGHKGKVPFFTLANVVWRIQNDDMKREQRKAERRASAHTPFDRRSRWFVIGDRKVGRGFVMPRETGPEGGSVLGERASFHAGWG